MALWDIYYIYLEGCYNEVPQKVHLFHMLPSQVNEIINPETHLLISIQ